jgi:hypothetical protein
MTQIALLSGVEINKPYVADTSQSIIAAIQSGEVNPLDLKLQVKAIESVLETIKPILDKEARNEAEKFGAKSFDRLGAKVELFEAATKYDYSMCNDDEYKDLLVEQEKLKLKIKQREKFLQAIDGKMTLVVEGTGEVVTVFPPTKSSTSTIKITLQ